jgi:hypothetical protein
MAAGLSFGTLSLHVAQYPPCERVSRKPRTPRRNLITVSGIVGPLHRLHSIAMSRLRLSFSTSDHTGAFEQIKNKITAIPLWRDQRADVCYPADGDEKPAPPRTWPTERKHKATAMRLWLTIVLFALLGCGPARAACAGPPYDQFDFWLGAWHDPAAPAKEHYTVTRTAGGCAIEEVLTGANGQVQGIGLSGWDSERKQWRQLWVDKDRIVTTYIGGPAADGTVVLISEPKGGGMRWRYTYRNIRSDRVDAEYASRGSEDAPWTTVWSGHFDRIGPAEK